MTIIIPVNKGELTDTLTHTESHKLRYNSHAPSLRLSSLTPTLPLHDAHMINDALIWVRLILASNHPEAESAGNLHSRPQIH